MVRCHRHSLLSLLPFQVRLPTHFKPTLLSQHTPLNVTYLEWTAEKTSSGLPKKKIKLQSTHSTRLSSFHPGIHTEVLNSKSSDHIIPRFKNYYIPQQPPKPQQQPTSNIPFTGRIGQRHENTMSDSCPQKLDGEMLPSRSGI